MIILTRYMDKTTKRTGTPDGKRVEDRPAELQQASDR
jgi:hypothetical protein